MKKILPITAIVLTFNEEEKIQNCLSSICDLVDQIIIVDSFSTDKTLEICKKYTEDIYQHDFENYSIQRNWSLENTNIRNNWVMNIDADHRITDELKNELEGIFNSDIDESINGFMASRKTVFMGRWIKHGGHYPVYHAFLFKKDYGKCEDKSYDQHFVVKGKMQKLDGDIEDIITDNLSNFIDRHNKWSSLEAEEAVKGTSGKNAVKSDVLGNPMERKRFLKNIFNNMPVFIRSILYFHYRYFFRLGFLDGKEGLIFHFLQGFWFRFLVDAKIYELRKNEKSRS